MVPGPGLAPVVEGMMARLREGLAGSATGAAYLNFLEGEEKAIRARDAMTAAAWDRLCELRTRLDPDGMMARGLDLG